MSNVEEKFPAMFEENDDLRGMGQMLTQAAGIFRFDFKKGDVVLMALPETDRLWIEVVEACFEQQVHMIIPIKPRDAAFIAESIREEKVTIVVISLMLWTEVFEALNAQPAHITRIQVIISEGKETPQTTFSLIPLSSPNLTS